MYNLFNVNINISIENEIINEVNIKPNINAIYMNDNGFQLFFDNTINWLLSLN